MFFLVDVEVWALIEDEYVPFQARKQKDCYYDDG